MNHEPECFRGEAGTMSNGPVSVTWPIPCNCQQLRAAYQRGREDAAKAVEAVIDRYGWLEAESQHRVIFGIRGVAAARGDGECSE